MMNISHLIESKMFKAQFTLTLCAFLMITTVIMLILCVWQWGHDYQLANLAIPTVSAGTNDNTQQLVASIPTTHLFGQSTKGDMPISSLQLQVTGIVKSVSEKTASKAYISIAGQPSKIYRINETLPDGVTIYDITENAVVLENNGHLEKLPLPREKLQFKAREQMEN